MVHLNGTRIAAFGTSARKEECRMTFTLVEVIMLGTFLIAFLGLILNMINTMKRK